jgi:hypothetical protein
MSSSQVLGGNVDRGRLDFHSGWPGSAPMAQGVRVVRERSQLSLNSCYYERVNTECS